MSCQGIHEICMTKVIDMLVASVRGNPTVHTDRICVNAKCSKFYKARFQSTNKLFFLLLSLLFKDLEEVNLLLIFVYKLVWFLPIRCA